MSFRFDNCMHYMHLHAMGACCLSVSPFPEKTHSRPLSHLALSRVSRRWLEGWHVRQTFIHNLHVGPAPPAAARPAFCLLVCAVQACTIMHHCASTECLANALAKARVDGAGAPGGDEGVTVLQCDIQIQTRKGVHEHAVDLIAAGLTLCVLGSVAPCPTAAHPF